MAMARAWKARGSNPSQVRVLSPPHFDKLSASPWMCMNWYTYILLCDQKIYYVGMTSDLERRIKQHKLKQSLFTKKFSDIKIVHYEEYETKDAAEKREKQLKGWSFAKKKALIESRMDKLISLSRST